MSLSCPPEALARLGARRHPVTGRAVAPSEATIRRTVKDIDADEADTIVGSWLHAKLQAGLVSPKAWRGLALDGKTLKGAWEEIDTGVGKVRLFSALTHAEGVALGQRRIPENTGEQAQMIPLLDQLAGAKPGSETPVDLSGVVVTAHALHVHRSNVEQILARNGEYVLTVKRNQPTNPAPHHQSPLRGPGRGFFPSPRHVTRAGRPDIGYMKFRVCRDDSSAASLAGKPRCTKRRWRPSSISDWSFCTLS
jgi:hypothetical protein